MVSDNAYSDIAYNGYRAPSFLETKGAMDVGIEMHSLSKTYNMTGWRIGMAVGNAEILAGLGRVKTNVDSGVFNAVQHAAITALSGSQDCVADACKIYQERRDVLVKGLRSLGFDLPTPKATFYVWLPVKDCMAFSAGSSTRQASWPHRASVLAPAGKATCGSRSPVPLPDPGGNRTDAEDETVRLAHHLTIRNGHSWPGLRWPCREVRDATLRDERGPGHRTVREIQKSPWRPLPEGPGALCGESQRHPHPDAGTGSER